MLPCKNIIFLLLLKRNFEKNEQITCVLRECFKGNQKDYLLNWLHLIVRIFFKKISRNY